MEILTSHKANSKQYFPFITTVRQETRELLRCLLFPCSSGLYIRMYYAPGEHPPPHFHAYYNEYRATVDVRTCEIIESNLPRRQTKLVLAWAELHKDELMANWHLVMNGEEPFKINPLL